MPGAPTAKAIRLSSVDAVLAGNAAGGDGRTGHVDDQRLQIGIYKYSSKVDDSHLEKRVQSHAVVDKAHRERATGVTRRNQLPFAHVPFDFTNLRPVKTDRDTSKSIVDERSARGLERRKIFVMNIIRSCLIDKGEIVRMVVQADALFRDVAKGKQLGTLLAFVDGVTWDPASTLVTHRLFLAIRIDVTRMIV